MDEKLTLEEQMILLCLAREALDCGVKGEEVLPPDLAILPSNLLEQGSCFVTLIIDGQLRGCIGSLEPY